MTDALGHLGSVSVAYQRMADSYRGVLVAAAEAEAAHVSARARRILAAIAEGEKVSHAKAETIAEADEDVAQLHRERLVARATADAHRNKLHQLREQVANGRTLAASEREIDKIHADGRGTA